MIPTLKREYQRRFPLLVGVVAGIALVVLVLPGGLLPWGPGSVPESNGPKGAGPLPNDPANCTQGPNVIAVPPLGLGVDESALFLSDYNSLGKEGGGTLELSTGYYQFNETVRLDEYNNISIQGAGRGATILTPPPDPVQHLQTDNGTPVGLFNTTTGTQIGEPVDLFLIGPLAVNNFEMCDLSLDAQVSGNSETWLGSIVFDVGGGNRHVYTDIDEVGFWGPSGTPNGIHLNGAIHPATNYIVDDLVSTNYTAPYTSYDYVAHGGPDFLDTGDIGDCSIENVTGIGDFEIEVAPDVGCIFANIRVSGHWLIDPASGASNGAYGAAPGSWGGTTFEGLNISTLGTPAPNALAISLANSSSDGRSDFSDLYWTDDLFTGTVTGGTNLVNVEDSTFVGTLDSIPTLFVGDTVVWNTTIPSRQLATLPMQVDGAPSGGTTSTLEQDVFEFPHGTQEPGFGGIHEDPLELNVLEVQWSHLTIEIGGPTSGSVFEAPNVTLSGSSTLTHLSYESLGSGAPAELYLLDVENSTGFRDEGAIVWYTNGIVNNLA